MNALNRSARREHANGVLQLRVVVEVADYDAATAVYLNRLGMAEKFLVDSGDDALVIAVQAVGRHSNSSRRRNAADSSTNSKSGRAVSPRIRIAFEVADVNKAANRLRATRHDVTFGGSYISCSVLGRVGDAAAGAVPQGQARAVDLP
jgi:hypothetical protein